MQPATTTEFLGKNISGPFTIPSGIVSTAGTIIDYIIRHIPQVGVITTKSVGPEPRLGNREPVLSQYAPGCFVNAVGLTNAGAAQTARVLSQLDIPDDRFLLTSIFGASVDEFVAVARALAPYSDGLELNLSCPHAKGYGMAIGQDPELVRAITAAVKAAVDIPVIPKLTPNTADIGSIARAAVSAGADAICAINTLGPGYYSAHGHPVLSNEHGGLSGKGVLPIGLKCVREIRATVDCPIIGCGGISSAQDVQAFHDAGATLFGVGSALVGLDSPQMTQYFAALQQDMSDAGDRAEQQVRYDIDMRFKPVELIDNERITDDIALLRFDRKIDIKAGEFIFLWVPGLGEKPFSALCDDPFTLVVINVGQFTEAMMALEPGTTAYVRGPYGIAVDPPKNTRNIVVAGGTGLAAVYQIARDLGNAELFIGARSKDRLYYLEETEAAGTVHIATDDGSAGFHGRVSEALEAYLKTLSAEECASLVFYNCGPEPMVHAACAVQRKYCEAKQINNAIDYLTKCGVGICGACAAPDGRRLCVDGPFLNLGVQSQA